MKVVFIFPFLTLFITNCVNQSNNDQIMPISDANQIIGDWQVLERITSTDTTFSFQMENQLYCTFFENGYVNFMAENHIDSIISKWKIKEQGYIQISPPIGSNLDTNIIQKYEFGDSTLRIKFYDPKKYFEVLLGKKDKIFRDRTNTACLICLENKKYDSLEIQRIVFTATQINKDSSIFIELENNMAVNRQRLDSLYYLNYHKYNAYYYHNRHNPESECLKKYPFPLDDSVQRVELLVEFFAYYIMGKTSVIVIEVSKYCDLKMSNIIETFTGKKQISTEAHLVLFLHSANDIELLQLRAEATKIITNDKKLKELNTTYDDWNRKLNNYLGWDSASTL